MFNKYGKKVLSLAMATAMAASMALPTFAANETSISAAYQDIDIAVTVPETGTVIINPYGLPVDVEGYDGVQISGQQITTQPLYITNNGKVSFEIGAKVTSTVGKSSGVKFVSDLTTTANTDKEIKLSLDMVASTVTGSTASENASTVLKSVVAEFADSTASKGFQGTGKKSTDLADGSGEIAAASKVTLVALKDAASGGGTEYQTGSIVLFRLSGEVNDAAEWTTKDTFTSTIAFTFTPTT
jgi:hypothetical protein